MSQEAKLYYEAHITIEPVFGERLAEARDLGKVHGMRVADLLMQKRQEDSPERSKNDTFMTGHGRLLSDITERVACAVKDLQAAGFQVWRYKVEDTLFDSRHEDVLGLLGVKA